MPHHPVESLRAAVQMHRFAAERFVGRQPDLPVVEPERGAGDPIAVAADQCAEEAFPTAFERLDISVSDYDVVYPAVAVRH